MKNRALPLRLLTALVVFGAWEIAGRVPIGHAFPTFLETMSALAAITLDGSIFSACAETLQPLVLGIAIPAVAGIGIGLTSKVFVLCILAMPVIALNSAGVRRNKAFGRYCAALPDQIAILLPCPSRGLEVIRPRSFRGKAVANIRRDPAYPDVVDNIRASLWEVVGRMEPTFFVPPVPAVLVTLFGLIRAAAFTSALATTACGFFAGVFLAVVIGIPVGILMGKTRPVDELVLPWVDIFVSEPPRTHGRG